ncbi:SAPA [Nesidiocoris tenuis]|uniref:SAPA n=1 Tax=Nesidiocoris tenuis TaxID=355587 RepID=A0ABN7A7A9_9HEMI|nr:SAPA [Nesidiocoris tenuis]
MYASYKLLLFGCFVCLALPIVSAKHVICYKGQSYWCQNITTAVECNAVKHCIQSVWEQEVPIEKDTSSICQTCIDMVKTARDQLESNETQEEIRQVLEGICLAIPEKHLKHDCDKLMDDFGGYLVDTLASQMNPDVVCSVAGLCYNDKYKNVKAIRQIDCDGCNNLMRIVEGNIETARTEDIQNVLEGFCRSLGSFSDVCSSLLSDHMESVDALVRNNVRAGPVCDLSGVCSKKFHNHKPRTHKIPQSPVEVQMNPLTDDLACDFCEQLVHHLRDVLIANTTEEEFKMVLTGLCKMSKFKEECDSFVNQYYEAAYYFLVNELDGKMLCTQIKICNATSEISKPQATEVLVSQPQQLPIERIKMTLVPESFQSVGSSPAVCSFCEYLLHFIQEEITLPSSEREITEFVDHICTKLPATVHGQCESFFDTYMNQFIAILANKIDPSQVCPSLGACPTKLVAVELKDKPTCPLCLLAMDETIKKVGRANRTEAAIHNVLDDLCMRDEFPTPVLTECVKFIQDFRGPITDMVIAEFDSQESCVYVNLCSPPADGMISPPRQDEEFDEIADLNSGVGDVATNEIHERSDPHKCTLCEFVMSKLAKEIADKKTEEEIKHALYSICSHMPKTVSSQCKQFVATYGDLVLNLLIQEVSPKVICTELGLCANVEIQIASPVRRCVLCEIFMDFLKTIVTNEDVDETLNKKMLRACDQFPRNDIAFCRSMVEQLGPQLEAILRQVPIGPLACRRIHLCQTDRATQQLQLLGVDLGPSCSSGAEYWCSSSSNAVECDKVEYCEKEVWKSETPTSKRKLKGSDIM